ncbi:MAG: hypothetical protein QOH06_528 [Acidobacteriota bacterium]|jgi:hypothetical protein|nr:hypothetical protein [Acidobacteriota bacterium]
MTNGYDEARGQRNVLERLGDKIPGFRGFQDRELRRDVDKMQREHLSTELGRLKAALRDKARSYTDAGKIGALSAFDRLDRQLDGLSQAVRFSDYGASGLFDAVKIGDAELQRLYAFDLSVLQDVEDIEGLVAAVPDPGGAPGGEDPAKALDPVQQRMRVLEDKWKQRELVISSVVKTGAGD